MKLATWNVNSIRARLPRVTAWVEANRPDVLCLQETKVEDAAFPHEPFAALGYAAHVHGQRTYNGVAILARQPVSELQRGLDDGEDDPEARFIVGRVAGLRVASVYVPNGRAVGDPKFDYKLRWLERLRAWLARAARRDEPLALAGDFNIAPDDRDVHDPEAWRDQVLCHPRERAALAALVDWGLHDVFRRHHAEAGLYSWWDYRQLGFPKNRGLRIDHVLCTEPLAVRCTGARIDREARKGQEPSDHAPVVIELAD